jgi:putative membrane protein
MFFVIWVLLIMAVFALMRSSVWAGQPDALRPGYGAPGLNDQPSSSPAHGLVVAEQILAERFARGEIEEDEFWQRMTTLRAGRPDGHAGV